MALLRLNFQYKPCGVLNWATGEAEGVESRGASRGVERSNSSDTNLATLKLPYTKKDLASYTQSRLAGISKASVPWMKRCSRIFWDITKGTISKGRCDALREHLSTRYTDIDASRKVLNFATAFLRYLAKEHFDTRYRAFELFL